MPSLRSIAFAAVAAAALSSAGPAAAKDFCTLGVPGCTNTYGGVQQVLDAAASDKSGPNRALIGSGTWIGNFKASGDVTIEGSVEGTALKQSAFGSAYGYPYTLTVSGTAAHVHNLRIALPAGYDPQGLALLDGASAEHVTIDGAGAHAAIGVKLGSGARFSGSVDVPAGNDAATMDTGTEIVDAQIAGGPAVIVQAGAGRAVIRRSAIVRHSTNAVTVFSGALTIEDSLLDARAPGAGAAVSTNSGAAAAVHTVDLRNVTMLGHGEESYSFGIYAVAAEFGDAATVTARDTVVANFGSNALYRAGVGTANLNLDHVDVFPASPVHENAAGTLTETNVTNADPGFAADGFTPAAGSPLADAGTPGPVGAGESATDLAGNPRVVALGCGEAVRDLGAIEAVSTCPAPAPPATDVPPAQPVADALAPRVTKLRIVHRRAVRFTLSEAARVTVRVSRGHRKPILMRRAAASGSVNFKLKRTLRHGRYAIRVIAVDEAGNRSAPAVVRRRI